MNDRRNPEEREILKGFEGGELRRMAGVEDEMETARQAARATFRRTRQVSLWVTERDFNLARCPRAGGGDPPYQTLLSSVVHKYLSGRLIEKR